MDHKVLAPQAHSRHANCFLEVHFQEKDIMGVICGAYITLTHPINTKLSRSCKQFFLYITLTLIITSMLSYNTTWTLQGLLHLHIDPFFRRSTISSNSNPHFRSIYTVREVLPTSFHIFEMAPPFTGTVVKLDKAQQDLQEMLSTIVHDIRHCLHTTEYPVRVDVDWLASRVQQKFHGNYEVVSNDDAAAAKELWNANTKFEQGLGSLVRLPREIRNMIFTDPIAAGDLNLTRVSRVVNEETTKLVSEIGVCRLDIGSLRYHDRCPAKDLEQNIVDKIQHVVIHVYYSTPRTEYPPCWLDSLKKFTGSETKRKYCRIELENRFIKNEIKCAEVLEVLESYCGFETLEVKIVFFDKHFMEAIGYSKFPDFSNSSAGNAATTTVRDTLSPVFGHDLQDRRDESWTMTYHPRKHLGN